MFPSVTPTAAEDDVDAVARHVERRASQSISPHWHPGRAGSSELALLDAVFSSRAPYGRLTTGVRRVVGAWSGYRRVVEPNDLTELAEFIERPGELEEILGHRGRVPGNALTKAAAAAHAARALAELGATEGQHLGDHADQHAAFVAVPGLGTVTWECLLIQLGVRTPAAVAHLRSFVRDALGAASDSDTNEFESAVSDDYATLLLASTAQRLGVELASLEHAVWRFQHRGRRRTTDEPERELVRIA